MCSSDLKKCERVFITHMRATDLTRGLRHLPAGFYVAVECEGTITKTLTATVSISRDVAEWDEEILLPSILSSIVSITVYATFEHGPRLGSGELLRQFTLSVGEVLDHNEQLEPVRFRDLTDELLSSCVSLKIIAERRKCDESDCKTRPGVTTPYTTSEAEKLTNQGHLALLSYRQYQDQAHLDKAITYFGKAYDGCPIDHPNRSTALFNLASATFIHCQANHQYLNLNLPIFLYREVLSLRTVGHPDHATTALELAFALLARFHGRGDETDKKEATDLLGKVVELSLVDTHRYQAGLFALRMAKAAVPLQANVAEPLPNGESLNLIHGVRAMLHASSHSDPRYPARLAKMGSLLCRKFWEDGDLVDIHDSISMLEQAVQLVPKGDADRPGYLNNLVVSLQTRFQRLGNIVDMDKSIVIQEEAVCLIPDEHPDKPMLLTNLGTSLASRFKRLGDVMDITKSVAMKEKAVHLTPDGHPDKPSLLNNLGGALLDRFQRLGDVADMTKSISIFSEAVRTTPDGHPDKPARLSNLGNLLLCRFQCFGSIADITNCISMQEEAVRLTPDGHPNKPSLLQNLGHSSLRQFQHFGDDSDITKSILVLEEAIRLTPDGHVEKPSLLNDLGNSMFSRFEHLGDVADITTSILMLEESLCLTPDGHPEKPSRYNNLGGSLNRRFERLGDVADLAKSISMKAEAVRLTPQDHPNKRVWLNNLGSSLLSRFERFGDLADITKSISMFEEAIHLTPDGHPEKPGWLHNLGISLSHRFERLGDVADITKSILVEEEAVHLTRDGHPEKPSRLNNLGGSLFCRFERLGDLADITRSISVKEEALHLTPDSHPDKPNLLSSLGGSLFCRFERFGDLADITKSVAMFEDATRLSPSDHPQKSFWLNNLGNALFRRFEHFGDVADISKSVAIFEEVINLIPDGHPEKPGVLGHLGTSLFRRFDRLGDVADMARSISMKEEAVCLTPDDHPGKPRRLANLGNSLSTRFQRLGNITDITKSISMHEEAIRLTPHGHPEKPTLLHNLSASLFRRFERFSDTADITKSVSMEEEAIRLTPDGHPDKPGRLYNLGDLLMNRFHVSGDSSDLSRASSNLSAAARGSTGPTSIRFEAVRRWISSARIDGNSQTLLDAYSTAIGLLPQLAWMGLPISERHHFLVGAADIARAAAAAALDANLPETAVEWLEQGRSIVWTQFLQLRTPVDLLRVTHPALADEFEQTSKELENATSREHIVSYDGKNGLGPSSWSLEQDVQRHHTLVLRREKLLADIRSLPGFDRFLLPKTFSQLAALADSGPVIYLNTGNGRCDAMIVMAGAGKVVHVPLSGVTYRHVEVMRRLLMDYNCPTVSSDVMLLLTSRCEIDSVDGTHREGSQVVQVAKPILGVLGPLTPLSEAREGGHEEIEEVIPYNRFRLVLEFLWLRVANPVLNALGYLTPVSSETEKLPRIFWCPTGPFAFLPIHAAGIYGPSAARPKLSDFAISSYIPTLSALGPGKDASDRPSNIHLVTVPQPPTDGLLPLYAVKQEINHIKALSDESPFVAMEDSDGTFEDVTTKMVRADWVHFACHGVQDHKRPLDSGLCLANGRRLKLSDIIRLSRLQGGLAFLSACQTAQGDEKLSEESVHLAAGMLLAGYGGVIATMWSIMDRDAPKVARDVYKYLFRDNKVPDTAEAAEALHRAVVRLRDEDKVSLSSWVPFIHVGR